MHPFVVATAVRLHVTHGALTEMRLVTTVALKRRRNHTPSHADCLPDAYRVYLLSSASVQRVQAQLFGQTLLGRRSGVRVSQGAPLISKHFNHLCRSRGPSF